MEDPNTLFALQNSHGHTEKFFEIYREYGQAPSKRFASPALDELRKNTNFQSV
jgi:hypothetical protein